MDRRRVLRAAGVGAVLGVAGCTGRRSGDDGGDRDGGDGSDGDGGGNGGGTGGGGDSTRPPDGPDVNPPRVDQIDLPVPRSELNRGAPKDGIAAITDPAFAADWSGVGFELADDERVIGVARDGRARAYPIAVLNLHEIVNDQFAGPLLVTFCPLCGSGLTAVRRVSGETTTFGVSGLLYRSDLVMYDEATDSLWSQIMATAIRGEATGQRLKLVPSALTTWGAWREDHPETEVLLPPPRSGTIVDVNAAAYNYDRNPYAGYVDGDRVGIGYNDFEDDRLRPKTQVIGVATDDAARAYPYGTVAEAGVVNDRVGDLPVVVAAGPQETLHAYDRRVDGDTLEFEAAGDGRMVGGNSEWTITTGEAVSGPHEGRRLDQASGVTSLFWFAWVDFHPDTTIYGRDG